jgi:hypothetical protein
MENLMECQHTIHDISSFNEGYLRFMNDSTCNRFQSYDQTFYKPLIQIVQHIYESEVLDPLSLFDFN